MSLLEAFKADNYRYGNLQAIIYDRRDQSIFKEGFVGELYFMLKGDRYSRKRGDGDGILQTLFCGMTDLSYDAIVPYLSTKPLAIMGKWTEVVDEESGDISEKFDVAGFTFPVTLTGVGDQKSCFAAYGFLPKYWGTEEQETLSILGLAVLFQELDVLSIHGTRYATNDLTARFMERFGFRDIGTLPHMLMRRGELVDGVISTLSRETFEANIVRRALEADSGGEGRKHGG